MSARFSRLHFMKITMKNNICLSFCAVSELSRREIPSFTSCVFIPPFNPFKAFCDEPGMNQCCDETVSKTYPSISASSWLIVCLEYGCIGDSILFPPTLSSSSMKITQGALALASPGEGKNNTHKNYCGQNIHILMQQ